MKEVLVPPTRLCRSVRRCCPAATGGGALAQTGQAKINGALARPFPVPQPTRHEMQKPRPMGSPGGEWRLSTFVLLLQNGMERGEFRGRGGRDDPQNPRR